MSNPLHPKCAECGTPLNPVRAVCSCSERLVESLGVDEPRKLARRLIYLETQIAGLVSAEQRRSEQRQRSGKKQKGQVVEAEHSVA